MPGHDGGEGGARGEPTGKKRKKEKKERGEGGGEGLQKEGEQDMNIDLARSIRQAKKNVPLCIAYPLARRVECGLQEQVHFALRHLKIAC